MEDFEDIVERAVESLLDDAKFQLYLKRVALGKAYSKDLNHWLEVEIENVIEAFKENVLDDYDPEQPFSGG